MRISTCIFAIATSIASVCSAQATDKRFFSGIQGQWAGPGEIVAGKYKGTKFYCSFGGAKPSVSSGMKVDGSCRVGVFSQPIEAEVIKTAGSYIGAFLDGAKGEGMDVTGGRYTRNRLVVDIRRKNLNGVMVANLSDPNKLKVTISVNHNNSVVPVIGMNLNRKTDPIKTSSIK